MARRNIHGSLLTAHSQSYPVRHLDREDVAPGRAETVSQVRNRVQVSPVQLVSTVLIPHQVQRRAGPEFPAQHRVGAE